MKTIRLWLGLAIGVSSALSMSSCVYDPSYYGPSVGSSYSYDSFGRSSTSVFISTGNPRWGYDPTCFSYFDYTTRRYYDPYLYGYYPVGFHPPIVIGVPHPHGWRPGRSFCPPPTNVRNVIINNYQHRDVAYRRTNHSWANQVQQRPNNYNSNRYDQSRGNRSNFQSSRYQESSSPSYRERSSPRNERSIAPSQNSSFPNSNWNRRSRPEPRTRTDYSNRANYTSTGSSYPNIQPTYQRSPQQPSFTPRESGSANSGFSRGESRSASPPTSVAPPSSGGMRDMQRSAPPPEPAPAAAAAQSSDGRSPFRNRR